MVKGDSQPGSFGVMTREEFQQLVAAPYGQAKERLNNPHDLLSRAMTRMILERFVKIRDPVADEDFLNAEASELAGDLLEKLDTWGLLR